MGRCHLLWGCKQGVARTGLWQLHKISIQVQQLQDSRCWDERDELDELSDILKSDQIFSRFRWFLVWKELQILIFLSNGFDHRVWMEPAWCFAVIIHNSLAINPKHPSLCRVFAVWSFGIPDAAASHCSARKFRVRAVKVSSWCIWTAGSKLSRPHLPAKPKPAKSAATRGDFDDVFNRKKKSALAATQTRRPSGPRQIKFSSTTNNNRHRHDHTRNHNPNN